MGAGSRPSAFWGGRNTSKKHATNRNEAHPSSFSGNSSGQGTSLFVGVRFGRREEHQVEVDPAEALDDADAPILEAFDGNAMFACNPLLHTSS